MKKREYFIAYNRKDKTIWGLGFKKSTARRDAKDHISCYGGDYGNVIKEISLLKTQRCSKILYNDIMKNGWVHQAWKIRKGMAVLK